jgi:hypothetical protein
VTENRVTKPTAADSPSTSSRAANPERPAPECRAAGYCCGPNAYVAVCDCYDAIWEGEKWWEREPNPLGRSKDTKLKE